MSGHDEDEGYSEPEISRRRDAAIGRALNTPPKPNKEVIGKRKRGVTAPSDPKEPGSGEV